MLDDGSIPEELFDELNFPPNLDMNGMVVPQEAGISCEPQQRAIILSALIVRYLRVLRQKELDAI